MALSDLLNQRRPHRADAARNLDAIIAAAREGFTDSVTEASLETSHAGPGSGRRRCTAISHSRRPHRGGHVANPDLTIDDVMRFVIGVTSSPFGSCEQRDRILDMTIAGIASTRPGK